MGRDVMPTCARRGRDLAAEIRHAGRRGGEAGRGEVLVLRGLRIAELEVELRRRRERVGAASGRADAPGCPGGRATGWFRIGCKPGGKRQQRAQRVVQAARHRRVEAAVLVAVERAVVAAPTGSACSPAKVSAGLGLAVIGVDRLRQHQHGPADFGAGGAAAAGRDRRTGSSCRCRTAASLPCFRSSGWRRTATGAMITLEKLEAQARALGLQVEVAARARAGRAGAPPAASCVPAPIRPVLGIVRVAPHAVRGSRRRTSSRPAASSGIPARGCR